MEVGLMTMVLQPFRTATETMMVRSTLLATTVTGGVLLRMVVMARGYNSSVTAVMFS